MQRAPGIDHRRALGALPARAAAVALVSAMLAGACGGIQQAPPEHTVCLSNADCNSGEICSAFGDACLPDCTHPERPCVDPLTCTPSPTDPGISNCDDMGPVPACLGTPTGQAVPFNETTGGTAVHWVIGDASACLPVTYEPSVAEHAQALRDAVATWNAIDCSRLCLTEPTSTRDRPDFLRGETGIHMISMFNEDTLRLGSPGVTTLTFTERTGFLLGAAIELHPDETISPSSLVTLVGFALGLSAASAGVDSALSRLSTRSEVPTDADREALCVLYGDPPYCE